MKQMKDNKKNYLKAEPEFDTLHWMLVADKKRCE